MKYNVLQGKKLSIGTSLLVIVCAGLLLASCSLIGTPVESVDIDPSMTPEPLLPSRTPTMAPVEAVATSTPYLSTAENLELPELTPSTSPTSNVEAVVEPTRIGSSDDLYRFGMTGDVVSAQIAHEEGMRFSQLLSWQVVPDPPFQDIPFWQMVRLDQDGIRGTTWEVIEQTIDANPGSYWLVGNEPDVIWQDNVTPERYAELYHEVYTFIKERDPEAQLVIGGVSQPTPLRRAYLDIILDSYQEKFDEPMPIDIWNVHAFTLREEADSWGVDIPPGMEGESGILYEIEDHNDVSIIRQNLIDFRAWMLERGYGDKPLVISEFGILMPEDYGFSTNVMGKFMVEAFELFLTEANETGYKPDNNHLVQWWFWYVLFEEDYYPYSRLFDTTNGEFTPLGEIWTAYLHDLSTR